MPKGQGRVRVAFHANNTESQIDRLVGAICAWAQEMIEIEKGGGNGNQIPKAARRVYAIMGNENSNQSRTEAPSGF